MVDYHWPVRAPSLPGGSLPDGLKRQMLNWAWAELCSRRAWQYSIMLAQTWGQRIARFKSLTMQSWWPWLRIENTTDKFQWHSYTSVHTLHLKYLKYTLVSWEVSIEKTHYISCTIYRTTAKPAAWPPPSPRVVLLSLRVQRSQPALAASPSHFLRDGPAETDTGAKKNKKRRGWHITTYINPTLKSRCICRGAEAEQRLVKIKVQVRPDGMVCNRNQRYHLTWNLLMWPWNSIRAAPLTSPPISRAPEASSSE